MPEKRICTERPTIHENFPEFPQCVFSQLHRSGAVFIFCPRPSRGVFHLVFPAFPFMLPAQLRSASLPITSSGASSQNILLEPPSLAPPWGLQTDRCPGGAQGLMILQIRYVPTQQWDQTKYRVQPGRRSASVSVTNRYETITYALKTGLTHQPVHVHLHRMAARVDSPYTHHTERLWCRSPCSQRILTPPTYLHSILPPCPLPSSPRRMWLSVLRVVPVHTAVYYPCGRFYQRCGLSRTCAALMISSSRHSQSCRDHSMSCHCHRDRLSGMVINHPFRIRNPEHATTFRAITSLCPIDWERCGRHISDAHKNF